VCVCPSVCLFSWRATQEKCASLLAIAANGTYARPVGRTEDRRQRDRRMRRQREINWRVCDRSSGPITKHDTSAPPPPPPLLLLLLLLAKTQWPCGHPRPAWYLCPGQRSDETTKLGLKLCRSQTHLAGWSKGPCPPPTWPPTPENWCTFIGALRNYTLQHMSDVNADRPARRLHIVLYTEKDAAVSVLKRVESMRSLTLWPCVKTNLLRDTR